MANKKCKDYSSYIGKRFGKLVVIGTEKKSRYHYFSCWCDCGNKSMPTASSVLAETSKSCGCTHGVNSKPRSDIKPNGESAFNYMFLTYKRNARLREYSFDIEREEFRNLVKQECFYCGCPPLNEVKYKKKVNNADPFRSNGLDRVNSSLGYSLDNVVPCCKHCNVAKASMSQAEFLDLISRIYNKRIKL